MGVPPAGAKAVWGLRQKQGIAELRAKDRTAWPLLTSYQYLLTCHPVIILFTTATSLPSLLVPFLAFSFPRTFMTI